MIKSVQVPAETPELRTPRLRLRTLQQSDADDIFSIYSDPQVMRYWSGEPITRLEEASAIISRNLDLAAQGNSVIWAVVHAEAEAMVGTCTLFKIDQQNRHAEVGFILNRQWWRQGLMSEAVNAMVAFGFEQMMLNRLEADVDPDNAASLALLKNIGFRKEGYFRQRWDIAGEWKDSVMLGLLAVEYDRR
jgi:RimJ/RimL family protein N-acetyltransferase